ncbi:SDR family NAD(P)-dependent oxidoreductase [Helicobacter didelphidarum]|uniref:SDR family NAD(P)-dependent oxidoreductase n=1 Tax=Helicobacter didelphidarum TaxID=2040648 RepID=UPI001FEA19F2|nr:SDR family oxidoreductase [Helicobacter didelphidarum]
MIFQADCFEGKRFLITGGSSGMGAHIALSLNALGAEVFALGRDTQKLESKKEQAHNQDNFITITQDMSQFKGLDKTILNLAKEYGSFDGAVLSAGIQQTAPIQSVLSVESATALFDINYFGNLQVLKGLLDKRAKSNEGASFVWISSNASVKAYKGIANYSASKAAINAAVKSIALEIAPKFRLNAISPGFVLTEMIESWKSVYNAQYIDDMDKQYPLGIGSVEKVSPLVCFLLSGDSAWITGQNIVIDGGGSL